MNIVGNNLAAIIWLILGVLAIASEFSMLPGIGLLFLGLGALLNATLVYNYILFYHYQYTAFGFSSLLCFIVLWWPLKKYIFTIKNTTNRFDIIGSSAEVYLLPLYPSKLGQVKWSGTIMNAQFDDLEGIELGNLVIIEKVIGNVLTCRKLNIEKNKPLVN
ncbi:MAG: NfeD family protein [Rickettsiaceae bacterium]|nr:MAG: NfeD family protein [Rickettsiaceae bacterium]